MTQQAIINLIFSFFVFAQLAIAQPFKIASLCCFFFYTIFTKQDIKNYVRDSFLMHASENLSREKKMFLLYLPSKSGKCHRK